MSISNASRITFQVCQQNRSMLGMVANMVRQERMNVERAHIMRTNPRAISGFECTKKYCQLTYNGKAVYQSTHEIAFNQALSSIDLSKEKNAIDIGGGTGIAAYIMAHHLAGKISSIEVDPLVYSLSKTIYMNLFYRLPSLERVHLMFGDFFETGENFLKGYDVIFHSCNLAPSQAKLISGKITEEMDEGALLILTYKGKYNFYIDAGRFMRACADYTFVERPNKYVFKFYRKIG